MNKEVKMQLQVNYSCDVCEETIHLDFEKSFEEKKLECPHCGVVYDFSEDDLAKFNLCYNELLQKMNAANKKQVT
jgi:DNA-directed RNA polymerase subunit RPC12/RpoP